MRLNSRDRSPRLTLERLEDRDLLAAGALDALFNSTGKQTVSFDLGGDNRDTGTAAALQGDGKIVVVGGVRRDATGDMDFGVARLNADGSLDTTFGSGGKATVAFDLGGTNDDQALDVALQSDGKIVVAGWAQRDAAGDFDFAAARLNADGSLDTSFDTDGKQTVAFDDGGNKDDRAYGVALQGDGKIVLAGAAQHNATGDYDFAVARLNPNGSLDTSFNTTGRRLVAFDQGGNNDDQGRDVLVQPDGGIVVVGYAQRNATGDRDFAAVRLTTAGQPDTTFGSGGRQTVAFDQGGANDDEAIAVARQADGRLVLAGFAQQDAAGDYDFAVARLTAAGQPDTSFNTTGRQTVAFDLGNNNEDQAFSTVVQNDGKILVAGQVHRAAANDFDFGVARLSPDGSLDTTFDTDGKQTVAFDLGGGNDDEALDVLLQPDGKVVLVGLTQRSATDYDFAVARLENLSLLAANFDKLGAYRANTDGVYSLDANGNGNYDGPPLDTVFFDYSGPGVIPVVGDWNNDGRDELGFFDDGFWHFDVNGNGIQDAGDATASFGGAGDTPVVGRFFGPGNASGFGNGLIIGVFTTRVGGIARFVLDKNANFKIDPGEETQPFGSAGDRVVVGDWTGDGVTKIGVFRPNPADNVSAIFSLDLNGNFFYDGPGEDNVFGAVSDGFLVGDWARVGRDTLGVYRPAPDGSGRAQFSLDVNGSRFYEPGVDLVYLYGNASDTFFAGNWAVNALTAWGGPGPGALGAPLTQGQLDALVRQGIAAWLAAGLPAGLAARLTPTRFTVADLGGANLGVAGTRAVTLDDDGAGYGWSVDGPAPGRVDALSAVLHEMGHELGLGDRFDGDPLNVMAAALATGTRRLPTPADVDAIFAATGR